VLLAGGSDGRTILAAAEFFDPVAETVSPAPDLAASSDRLSATTLLDGRVLLTGGAGNSLGIYDPIGRTPIFAGYPRSIYFSGENWFVKAGSGRLGPGPNYFSDSQNNVWVDSQGRLHLRITKVGGKWYCAEVISARSFGYGTYRFYLDSPVDALDSNAVVGLFTWSDDPAFNNRELDIEFGRWGTTNNLNAQ